MTEPLFFGLFGRDSLTSSLACAVNAELGGIEFRRFPDGESYLRYLTSPENRSIVIVCCLNRPDDKILPLLLAAETARKLGAKSVGLVCPYLPYMRQDKQFKDGEVVSAPLFANLLSSAFDWLVTIDPHLHRIDTLSDIYAIPTQVLHAAPLLAEWVQDTCKQPLIIGPDAESDQWVALVARLADAPYVVLEKIRYGDRKVKVALSDISQWRSYTPIILDDIISTAHTMIETAYQLKNSNENAPICVAVHGIFADQAYQQLLATGVAKIVTCNTIHHESNMIDVTGLLAAGVREFLPS